MILILLGTQDNSFHRLLDKVQELIDKKVITEKVIVQAGRTKFESKDMEIYSLMPEEKLREIMEKADLVITHGGVGSIVMALKMGKKVIAVPRLSAFGEHINDHQIQIVDSFDKQDFLIGVTELDDLEEALNKAKTFKPKHFKSETDHMIKIIINRDLEMPIGILRTFFCKNGIWGTFLESRFFCLKNIKFLTFNICCISLTHTQF